MTRRRAPYVDPTGFESARVDPLDDAPVLQAMFDAAADLPPGATVWWGDRYRIASTVTVRGDDLHHVVGRLEVTAPVDAALRIDALRSRFTGILRLQGHLSSGDGVAYAGRTCGEGVTLGDVNSSTFDGFDVRGFRRSAVRLLEGANQIDADLGRVRALDCGSPAGAVADAHPSVLTLAWSGRVDTGGPTSPLQRSTVTVPAGHPLEGGDLVLVDGDPYSVDAVTDTTLSLFPWLSGSATSGTLVCAHGAALDVGGGNTTGVTCTRVGAIRCGVGLRSAGLYGITLHGLTGEALTAGIQVMGRRDAAHLGGAISSWHVEASAYQGIRVGSATPSLSLLNATTWDPDGWVRLLPRATDGAHPQAWTLGDGWSVVGRA